MQTVSEDRLELDGLLQASVGRIMAMTKQYLDGRHSPMLSQDDLTQEVLLAVVKDFPQFRGNTMASYCCWLGTSGRPR